MNQRNRSAMAKFRRSSRFPMHAAIALAMVCVAGSVHAQQDFNQGSSSQPPPAQNQNGYMNQQQAAPVYRDNGTFADPGYPNQDSPGQSFPEQQDRSPNPVNQDPSSAPASGYGQPANSSMAPGAKGNPLQQLVQSEMQDYGIPAQSQLQTNLHGPTPTSIPGGQVITTDRLLGQIQQGQQSGVLIFHVLGQGDMIPGAQYATPASQAGTFSDQTQQEFGKYLAQVTQGRKDRPMVFYCLNTQCWMSYNAALRAINMGYSNVLWYRGGIEAWQRAQQIAANMQPQGNRMAAPDMSTQNPY